MDEEFRRTADIQIAELNIKFSNFMERYERDVRGSQKDMAELLMTIKEHDSFIKDIRPLYSRGMMALGTAILGLIGLSINWLWVHIKWK